LYLDLFASELCLSAAKLDPAHQEVLAIRVPEAHFAPKAARQLHSIGPERGMKICPVRAVDRAFLDRAGVVV
jgi:adenosyl cobinamide kinase/adenosyl cobinamide phosphate guanylyltransferase